MSLIKTLYIMFHNYVLFRTGIIQCMFFCFILFANFIKLTWISGGSWWCVWAACKLLDWLLFYQDLLCVPPNCWFMMEPPYSDKNCAAVFNVFQKMNVNKCNCIEHEQRATKLFLLYLSFGCKAGDVTLGKMK